MSYNGKWLKNPEQIAFEVDGAIARITLNRPEKRNAFARQACLELKDAMLEADDRTDVSVIILSGAGKDFCAGHDIGGFFAERSKKSEGEVKYRSFTSTPDDSAWTMNQLQEIYRLIPKLHKPVIAKIHGNCFGAGVELAFVCDLIIAADDTKIAHIATRCNGNPLSEMWVYHMGPQWTKRMLFTGDSISGADAAKIGLVLESVPADELDEHVDALAKRISAVDNELLTSHKRIVNYAMDQMGATAVQKYAIEQGALGELNTGPRRAQFKKDIVEHGMKEAVKNRDAPFGDGWVKVNR